MKIRSITSFYDPRSPTASADLETLAQFSRLLRDSISRELLSVQSTRLATIPFPYYLPLKSPHEAGGVVSQMERHALELGWDYLSLGPAQPEFPDSYALIPTLLQAAPNIFCSAVIAEADCVHPRAIRSTANIIHRASGLTPDGFTNLRFAALANVRPYAPFLPAAYAKPGGPLSISIAVECADVVLSAFKDSRDLQESRQRLITQLDQAAIKITSLINEIGKKFEIVFRGFDFSPAPFPEDWCSLGGAVEAIGLEHIGGLGSLSAVALIADTLDNGHWQKVGFNGMMLPVLEDSILSRRAMEGTLSIQDLLLYSAVCGTGLDTIPISGDVTNDELMCILADIASLAVRLGKPLTARLMPLPGKVAGDLTSFNFEYFSNTRVMATSGQKLQPPFFSDTPFQLSPRHPR